MIPENEKKINAQKAIWFDFENAPHVWVLKPIYEYFKEKGYQCYCSARRFSYTLDLLKQATITADTQDVLVSKNRLIKILSTTLRALRLILLYRKKKISLAVGHGSRSQILAAKILHIPVISLDDYEKSDQFLVRFTFKTLVPDVISKSNWGRYQNKIHHYPGLKEQIYLGGYHWDEDIFAKLNLNKDNIIVLLRPETAMSHYYDNRSTELLRKILEYLSKNRNVSIIFLPRNKKQQRAISKFFDIYKIRYSIPDPRYFGFEIVGAADLVIGGGGTMLREAACLGIPAYSYFSGEWGAVDNYLVSTGRLIRIRSKEDIKEIKLVKCHKKRESLPSHTREFILKFLESHLGGISECQNH